jgi:4'-phosphopantetheinyl transferase
MSTEELQWHHGLPCKLTKLNEVHVWRVLLDVTTVEFESLLGFLSVDEMARVGRFHFERDQKRFIVARGVLRKILGRYLEKHPNDIRFEYNPHGKPALAPDSGKEKICFNLSHSGAIALYAITRDKKIGIDIEHIRHDMEEDLIARKFFSQGEIISLEKTDKNNRSELFFQYWTRKEAFVKATGEGVSFPMQQCDVSSITRNSLSPIILSGNNEERSCWHVRDLYPGEGYAAAIAIQGNDGDISCWHSSL